MILMFMLFMHVIDDFHLQGCLATLKQKKYWFEECEKLAKSGGTGMAHWVGLFGYDWIPSLLMHAFQWSFMVMLPIFVVKKEMSMAYIIALIANTIVHAIVDHFKCNRLQINLIIDQFLHIVQIVITYAVLVRAL